MCVYARSVALPADHAPLLAPALCAALCLLKEEDLEEVGVDNADDRAKLIAATRAHQERLKQMMR